MFGCAAAVAPTSTYFICTQFYTHQTEFESGNTLEVVPKLARPCPKLLDASAK